MSRFAVIRSAIPPLKKVTGLSLIVFNFAFCSQGVVAQTASEWVLEWENGMHRSSSGREFTLIQPLQGFVDFGRSEWPMVRMQFAAEPSGANLVPFLIPVLSQPISLPAGSALPPDTLQYWASREWDRGRPRWVIDWVPYLRTERGVVRIERVRVEWKARPGSALKKQQTQQTFGNSSALSGGIWARFEVTHNGVYRLLPADLSAAGFDLSSANPAFFKVYGVQGGMLSESNADRVADDLQELPVLLIEDGNGRFDGSDRLVFYAEGPDQWTLTNGVYTHQKHLYTDRGLVWVTLSDNAAKSPMVRLSETQAPTAVRTDFDDAQFVENDLENLVGTGKQWFGEKFDFTLQYNFVFSIPNAVPGQSANLRFRAGARSSSAGTSMVLSSTGGSVSASFAAVDVVTPGADFVRTQTGSGPVQINSPVVSVTATYQNASNPSAIAWLDYIELLTRRNLSFTGVDQILFRDFGSVGPGNVVEFVLSGSSANVEVWDVTQPFEALSIRQVPGASSIRVATDSLREFVAFHPDANLPRPVFAGNVENQNLHALAAADMVILHASAFREAAERLAEHHRNSSGLTVHNISVHHVFNEFSGGVQDPTAIKSFLRMLYQRPGSDTLRYVLLFGDASYDYKDRIPNNTNWVPTYESEASFSLNNSYCSDDYYGFLDPNEKGVELNQLLDVGIGRFVVRTPAEANTLVNKVIDYSNPARSLGAWRNRVLFAADDVDASWETVLMDAAERAALAGETSDPRLNQIKVYQDAFVQVINGGSERYPEAQQAFVGGVELGNLLTAYTGHGGEIGLASERILQLVDVNSWTNGVKAPLMITITCEFTRFDDPKRISAGEYAHLNPNGGAIALMSTQRVVYASQSTLNMTRNIVDTVFSRAGRQRIRLGDVLRIVKNASGGGDRRVFSLFGDPAMPLNTPLYDIELTEVNGRTPGIDTLKALSRIEMKGRVIDGQGQWLSDFNGPIDVLVYDKEVSRVTLVNDGIGAPLPFNERKNILYSGKATVVNGQFSFEFIVPLDIGFNYGTGRMSAYAHNNAEDASGWDERFQVGGQDLNAPSDNQGPDIKIFLNDPSFVNGGISPPNPLLLAQLSDSSGINTAGLGIGHEIALVLDGNINAPIVLNDRYQSEPGSYQKGQLTFPLGSLSPGPHTLELRAWDTYNNPSSQKLDFVVRDEAGLRLEHVLNYPNPFTTATDFQFEHNRPGEELDVLVRILTVSGKQVKTLRKRVPAAPARITGIPWDGKDDFGDRIGRGTYLYQLSVRSLSDGAQAEEYQKLVILR